MKNKKKAKSQEKVKIFNVVKRSDYERLDMNSKMKIKLNKTHLVYVDTIIQINRDFIDQVNLDQRRPNYVKRIVDKCIQYQTDVEYMQDEITTHQQLELSRNFRSELNTPDLKQNHLTFYSD